MWRVCGVGGEGILYLGMVWGCLGVWFEVGFEGWEVNYVEILREEFCGYKRVEEILGGEVGVCRVGRRLGWSGV